MKTNSIIYKTDKIKGNKHVFVTIRLNDECKNGHQDFAITADIYQAGKPKTDRYHLSSGCCHEEIIKAFPEFKMFVDLHLCDYLGNPMYAVENGFYHLENGFNNTPVNSPLFASAYCEYYRLSIQDFTVLREAKNSIQFYLKLIELDIPAKWKVQADEAIKTLEGLTGDEFIVDSTKTQLGKPADEKIQEELNRVASGYYSYEAIEDRKQQAHDDFIKSLEEDAQKGIDKINRNLEIKKALFEIGGKRLLDNVIYYDHTNSISFNWRSYGERIEQSEAETVVEELKGYKIGFDSYKVEK